ncbi:MAG: LemA family protein [Aerococcus sp.]|nr:LemA family protein [Aerococcus sp.]
MGWLILGIIIAIIIGLIIWGVRTYNKLIGLQERVANSMAQIAAQVESRWDALTNLIQATKQYQTHEYQTLMEIVRGRSGITKDASATDVEQDSATFERAMRQLNIVAEQYPDLKASNVYHDTMQSVNQYENNVRQARMVYNDTVTRYNRMIKVFPNSLIAGMTGFSEKEYFENTASKQEMPQW